MKAHIETIMIMSADPELLDVVIDTCNYEASGDGVVLVDTDQLDNTSNTSGQISKLAEKIQHAAKWNGFPLETKTLVGARYTGLILLRA